MNTKQLRNILDTWAAWVQDGRPLPGNAYPNHSIITQIDQPHHSNPGPRALWNGKLKSHWLDEVDRAIRGLSEERQLILLGMHLPGIETDNERRESMNVGREKVRYARKLAADALRSMIK